MRHLLALLALSLPFVGEAAQAGTLATATVERIAPERLVIRWDDRDPVDVFVADRPDASPDTARLVSDDDRDGSHELAAPTGPRPYVLLRDTRSGQTLRVAERLIPLAQGSNFRDIGGYPAAGGKHVRWGMIYRSGATPLLTDADLDWIKALGLANMIDLRSSEERVLAPSRIKHVPYTAIGYSMTEMMPTDPAKMGAETGGNLYREMPAFLAPHVKIVFAKLLRMEGPMVYNCSAGQDRTGFVSAMVLSALGVPRDVIIADYHLSTGYRRPEYEMPKLNLAAFPDDPVAKLFAGGQERRALAKPQPLKAADGTALLSYAFASIEQRWGSVEAYLDKEAGVTAKDIETLRANYLE